MHCECISALAAQCVKTSFAIRLQRLYSIAMARSVILGLCWVLGIPVVLCAVVCGLIHGSLVIAGIMSCDGQNLQPLSALAAGITQRMLILFRTVRNISFSWLVGLWRSLFLPYSVEEEGDDGKSEIVMTFYPR